MPLKTFEEELELAREMGMLDPETLGRDMAQSFIVETRVALEDDRYVKLPGVGKLSWNEKGETIEFEAEDSREYSLKEDARYRKLRLRDFLDKKFPLICSRINLQWDKEFQALEAPYSGLDLLGRLGSKLLSHVIREDRTLEKAPYGKVLEGMCCYVVHDAICIGTGIDLETIGTFYLDELEREPKFEPDNVLVEFMKARSSYDSRNSSRTPGFFITSPEPGVYEKHKIHYAKR